MKKRIEPAAGLDIEKLFNDFENEYLSPDNIRFNDMDKVRVDRKEPSKDRKEEAKLAREFLRTDCGCGKHCQNKIELEDLVDSRSYFTQLSWREKGCFLLPLLKSFQVNSNESYSGRVFYERSRQKYIYRINSNREICRDVFLFYHGISLRKLKYFQHHLNEVGITPSNHGNVGKVPINAYSDQDKNNVKIFMINFSSIHGLPDPGRDLRTDIKKLKIFLPTTMTYRYVHGQYLKSISKRQRVVEYRSFITLWQLLTPNIEFQRPRTDLCKTCEDHIKNIRISIGRKDDESKLKYYREALKHLQFAKKERNNYKKINAESRKTYQKLLSKGVTSSQIKSGNKNKFSLHYSWDFAQQINFPYEDQQVGPIYFKTPRKAQLFGICCEAVPRQVNYLIDEADFLNKGPNTVISLIHHFFSHHGFGESSVYLTADNCVGQNKNNAMIHYLLYRTMMNLHSSIDLSFMIVGHTKFAPDGYFGLIKRVYRKSKIYTYDDIVDLIQNASPNDHIRCQPFKDKKGKQHYQYCQWDTWLSTYFSNVPQIKSYQHFSFRKNQPGKVSVKETIDGKEHTFNLLKDKKFRFNGLKPSRSFVLKPAGLSIERQWYLYEKIREHIPLLEDKDKSCPLPKDQKK